jgi:hypothetical protein
MLPVALVYTPRVCLEVVPSSPIMHARVEAAETIEVSAFPLSQLLLNASRISAKASL